MEIMKKSMKLSAINRRKNVIARLETQLKSGTKTEKGSIGYGKVLLSDKDKARIQKELLILKSRI